MEDLGVLLCVGVAELKAKRPHETIYNIAHFMVKMDLAAENCGLQPTVIALFRYLNEH